MDLRPPKFRTSHQREMWRDREHHRCLRSSWYLATEFLGYEYGSHATEEHPGGEPKGLVRRVHKPIMDLYDRYLRVEKRFGLWMARGRHKTTLVVSWHIQDVLRDPGLSHRYWHDNAGLATEFLKEVWSHWANNEKLRALDPFGRHDGKLHYVLPKLKGGTRPAKFGKDECRYELKIPWRTFGVGVRAPTLRAQGVWSAVTGAHINGRAWFDDIISEDTIRNSRIQAVTDFVRQTAFPVVDSKRFGITGTPWNDWSFYQETWKDKRWNTIIVPGAISESDEEYERAFKEAA